MNIKNKVTKYYNRLYKSLVDQESYFVDKWLRERELKNILSFVKKEDIVLDIGCGKGEPSFLVSKKAKWVIGVDISAEAIHAADKRKREANVKNCSFIIGDIDNLKYNKNSFNFILCLGIFEYFSSIDNQLKNMHKILKKGGRLYFHVWNKESLVIKTKKMLGILDKNKPFERSFFSFGEVEKILQKHDFFLEKSFGQTIADKPFKIFKLLNIELKNKKIFNFFELVGKINFFARFFAENLVFVSRKM